MTDKQQLRNFVNGDYVDPADGDYADLVDPCTGRGVRRRRRSPGRPTSTGR